MMGLNYSKYDILCHIMVVNVIMGFFKIHVMNK